MKQELERQPQRGTVFGAGYGMCLKRLVESTGNHTVSLIMERGLSTLPHALYPVLFCSICVNTMNLSEATQTFSPVSL